MASDIATLNYIYKFLLSHGIHWIEPSLDIGKFCRLLWCMIISCVTNCTWIYMLQKLRKLVWNRSSSVVHGWLLTIALTNLCAESRRIESCCEVFDNWWWKGQYKPFQICPWESNNPQVLSALQPCLHWRSNGDLLPNLEVLRRVQSSGKTILVCSATEVHVHFATA